MAPPASHAGQASFTVPSVTTWKHGCPYRLDNIGDNGNHAELDLAARITAEP